jgi:hypothetical protein
VPEGATCTRRGEVSVLCGTVRTIVGEMSMGMGWDAFPSSGGFGRDSQDSSSGLLGEGESDRTDLENRTEPHSRAYDTELKSGEHEGRNSSMVDQFTGSWALGSPSSFAERSVLGSNGVVTQTVNSVFVSPSGQLGDEQHRSLHPGASSEQNGIPASQGGLPPSVGEGEVSSLLHILGADLYGALDDESGRCESHTLVQAPR